MKKIIVIVLLLSISASLIWADDAEVKTPTLGFSLLLTDSLAFMGIGLELYLGHIGLGATFTTMFFSSEGVTIIFAEPGAYGRFYFFDPSASMYLGVGLTYWTFFGGTGNSIQGVDAGLLNLNGAIGFNAMFGNKKEFRFAIEIGPRYVLPTAGGTTSTTGFIFPHFLIQFGMNV
jgi:outer membrane protein W